MNLRLCSLSLLTVLTVISVEGSTLVDRNLAELKANIKIKNSGLKCYQCTDTSCDKPQKPSQAQVQKCSDLNIESLHLTDEEFANFDFSNVAYTCIKVSTTNGTERGCSFNKIDNKEYCDVARALIEGLNNLVGALNNFFSRKPSDNTNNEEDFKCNICDTDLCNSE